MNDSTPRAIRAAWLLPEKRSALTVTARSTGMPFQCVTSTPVPNGGASRPWARRVTRYVTADPSRHRSTWNGR